MVPKESERSVAWYEPKRQAALHAISCAEAQAELGLEIGRSQLDEMRHHLDDIDWQAAADYEKQLRESCRLVADELGLQDEQWDLVYQSRSGRPQDPWLEPDICDHVAALAETGVRKLVISPIGFLSDHIEVLFDLDDEAAQACREHKIEMARAATPGTHPRFVTMLRKLIQERLDGQQPECIGQFGPSHDVCPADCCPAPRRRPAVPNQDPTRS